jgi:hypothetical protein
MFQRQPGKPEKQDVSSYSRRSAAADSAWTAQDRIRSGIGHASERTSYVLQKHLIWPLQDRAGAMSATARQLSFAAVVLLAAGAGVAGLLLTSSSGSSSDGGSQVALAPQPVVEVKAAVEKPAEPTLHGAAPVFKPPADSTPSAGDPAEAIVKSAPAETDASDSSTSDGSAASASASAAGPAGADSGSDGPPAGPRALAVARDFSDAFVVYETGGLDSSVRRAFGATATPQLSRALLQRPPRLPANVKVPQAKVLNVVAGPSQDGVYTVSVSLLRVGSTSELRLDLEQLKGKEWRVTNVLG